MENEPHKEKKVAEEAKVQKDAERPLQNFGYERPKLSSIAENSAEEIHEEPVTSDAFVIKIINFLKTKEITVKNFEIKRKNAEADLYLMVPSAVGHIEYYCKAKDKKKVNDSDISSAYVQGQIKKLPAIFLTTGDLTKKAKEMLSREIKISVLKVQGV